MPVHDRGNPSRAPAGGLAELDADGGQRPRFPATALRPLLASKFAMVGASGLVVNQFLLWAAVAIGGFHYVAGAVLATQGSTTWNFLLLDWLVFPGRKASWGPLRYLAFSGVNNLTLLLRVPMLALLVSLLHVHYLVSNAITLVVLFATRFMVSDRLIWKAPASATGTRPTPPEQVRADVQEPATRTYRYEVAGIVAIESEVVLRELAAFAAPALGRPADISVRVGRVGNGPRRRPVVTHGPTFVAYEEHLGRAAANFRLDFGDRIDVTVGPLLGSSPHVVYTNVVEALLRFVLASRDHILLHSATVQLEDRGVMLTARTDTGKTGTILRLLRDHQVAFLSDDMTIVAPNGLALSYPKPLTISSHTLAAVDLDVLPRPQQLKLAVQSRVHSRSGRSIGSYLGRLNLPIMALNALAQSLIPPPKYPVDRLLPCQFAPSTTVRDLFVLERGPAALEQLDRERAVEIMIANTDDAYGFPPFRYFAPAITIDGQDYAALREHERNLLTRFLRDVRARRLARDDFSWASAIPRLIGDDEGLVPGWPS